MRWSDRSSRHDLGFGPWVVSCLLLLIPTAVLGALAYRLEAAPLAAGAGVQLLFVLVFLQAHPVWRPPVSASVVVLYLIALGWAWLPTRGTADWAVHVGQGVLLLGAVGLVALHDLTRTGAEPLRRANKWSRRITFRSHWPLQLADCRRLPEADALREAVADEPGPALALLSDPRPQVQTAALGALEYRPHWRPGEAELVLRVAKASPEPAVRAAAAYALAGVRPAELIEGLAGFLRDPAPEVRHAAAEALLWDGDARWPSARDAVREALADPKLAADGPLFVGASRLPAAAIADLTMWTAEHTPLAGRAVQTLIEQYQRGLLDADRPELASDLAGQMLAAETPPALRIELAALLRDHHMLGPDLLDRMTNLDQLGPMRLFAAEVMLRANPNDPDGVDVLRGLARQPNRELAVQIGGILQNVLGLELGLPGGGQLPAPNSKAAADVARRVLAWANGATPDMIRPTPGPQPGLKGGSRPPFAGLKQTTILPPPSGERPRGSSAVF
ncbi:MAG: repeat protein [Gemmataceae bacterium]|nr:repeat protein [Gemmataceae bacterium]